MFSSVLVSAPSNWTTCVVGPGIKSSWLPRTVSVPGASVRSLRQRLTGEVRRWSRVGEKKHPQWKSKINVLIIIKYIFYQGPFTATCSRGLELYMKFMVMLYFCPFFLPVFLLDSVNAQCIFSTISTFELTFEKNIINRPCLILQVRVIFFHLCFNLFRLALTGFCIES